MWLGVKMVRATYSLGKWWFKLVMIFSIAFILLSLSTSPTCPDIDDLRQQIALENKLEAHRKKFTDHEDNMNDLAGAKHVPDSPPDGDGVKRDNLPIGGGKFGHEANYGDELKAPEPVRGGPESKEIQPNEEIKEIKTKTTTESLHEIERLPVDDVLDPTASTNVVYYVWCGRRWFEFQHYLSVMSVVRELRPDSIIFYYDFLPVMDYWLYNTYFNELKEELPFFHAQKVDTSSACSSFSKVNQNYIFNLLNNKGGMYIHENTIIDRLPFFYRKYDLVHALDFNLTYGFIMARKGMKLDQSGVGTIISNQQYKTKRLRCESVRLYNSTSHGKSTCVYTIERFFPKDHWEGNSRFTRLVRRVFYGNPNIPQVRQSSDVLVPNIAHIVWLGGGEMDFLFYLCVLSLIYVAEVDMVYIHGDAPPSGYYWASLQNEAKLKHIFREPVDVYGNPINIISHVTDVWRVDFMIKYGGIYVDTDTAFVRPLDDYIRSFDAVGTYDWTYWNPPFPDTINFGVTIGKKGAKYWKEFQKTMKWFIDKDWSWNGLRQPYKIKERQPELLRIDPRLQVTCFEFKCHPTWWPDYHNESVHHLNSNSIPDWRKDIYAFHWTLPTPPELKNEQGLAQSNTIFAEIGRHILRKAGRLKD